jgi:hypothetical protein
MADHTFRRTEYPVAVCLAGAGESALSTTVAKYFRELGRLGAFIFFDRNDPTHSDPNAVIRTLAHQLALWDLTVQSAVCAAIEGDKGIAEAPMRRQYAKLVLEPLKCAVALHIQGPIIIVIDALDECGNSVSRQTFLALLAQELAKFPPAFRFLITNRAESDITDILGVQPNVAQKVLSITTDSNTEDIHMFLQNKMDIIRQRHRMYDLASD